MGEIKRGKFTITLRSDLCLGSGYSYAGIVDNDTCYDEYGIPYIPAKRIKGCLRETAETLLYSLYSADEIEKTFGVEGNDHGVDFMIDNAYISDYENIRAYFEVNPQFDAQAVLSRFTRIEGQTRMINGVAERGSLRYTRVVNHYSPIDKKELSFTSDFTCDADEWEMILKVAQATRHIGLKRNRGLGNIKIEVSEYKSDDKNVESLLKIRDVGNGMKEINYAISNLQPLMLSRDETDESVEYIPGQQVLGMLASKYLRIKGKSADDQAFQDLFLNGQTTISNLYPYDGENIYYPAPYYLNRLKKSKTIVYNIFSSLPKTDDDEHKDHGDLPKLMKGKFVAWLSRDEVSVFETKKDVIYHHSHRNTHEIIEKDIKREEGILYSQEVIRKGQKFAGTIMVPESHLGIVKDLLSEGEMYFGRSKTAQYGKCRLVEYIDHTKTEKRSFGAGQDIVVTFKSDALINNDKGNPTVFYQEVRDAVGKTLGISSDEKKDDYISSIQTTLSTGYMGKWNLRKSAVPAIKAGSFLTYHLTGDFSWNKDYIGERTLEGYGNIGIHDAYAYSYDGIKEIKKKDDGRKIPDPDKAIETLVLPVIYDRWLERRINSAIDGNEVINISNTAVGRIILMLRESMDEKDNVKEAYIEFGKRIDSFKTGNTKEEGRKILNRIGSVVDKEWTVTEDSRFIKTDKVLEDELKEAGLVDHPEERIKRWPDYVMAILTDRKYKGRK